MRATDVTTPEAIGAAAPRDGLLERVTALVPLIRERSFSAEKARRPDDDVIDALKATGVFRAFVPARHGGYELDLPTYVDIGITVAEADPSMGWITTFYMEHNWLLTLFSTELQDEVFSSQPFVLAPGSVNPTGIAVPQEGGGFLLSGDWRFGTGICHADWVLLSGRIEGDESGIPRNFLTPVDTVEVTDGWHVDGMSATGSRDISARDVFIPDHRVSLAVPPGLTAGPDAGFLLRIPIAPFLSLTAAMPALGAARRAVHLFQERLFERIQFGTNKAQAQRVPAQVRLANLRVELDAAETLLRYLADRMQRHADGEANYSFPEQQEQRLAIAHVVRRCRSIIRDVVEASGASVHYLDDEIQRLHRDIHMICAHTVFDVDLLAEGIGRGLVKNHQGAST